MNLIWRVDIVFGSHSELIIVSFAVEESESDENNKPTDDEGSTGTTGATATLGKTAADETGIYSKADLVAIVE